MTMTCCGPSPCRTSFARSLAQLDGMDASLVRLRLPLVEATDKLGDVSAAISARKREVAATLEDDATLAARAAGGWGGTYFNSTVTTSVSCWWMVRQCVCIICECISLRH